jgi:hypothetical protein
MAIRNTLIVLSSTILTYLQRLVLTRPLEYICLLVILVRRCQGVKLFFSLEPHPLINGHTDTSFQQYGWLHGENDWTIQDHWPNKNSQAGVGCYSWAPGSTVSYVFMSDLDNTLNIYWKGDYCQALISSGQLDWGANSWQIRTHPCPQLARIRLTSGRTVSLFHHSPCITLRF